MKKTIIALAAALSMAACMKDQGNYDYGDAAAQYPALLPEGSIEPSYDRKSGETLLIDPHYAGTVDDSDYDYVWFVANSKGERDTLARTLRLELPVVMRAGVHKLHLKVTNRKNEISRGYSTQLNVITDFTEGWFVTKALPGDLTDIDLRSYDDTKRMANIYKGINDESLTGSPVSMVYDGTNMGGYEWVDPVDGKISMRSMFIIATTKEVHAIEANEMLSHYANADLFLGAPAVMAPQSLQTWVYGLNQFSFLNNNGRLHWLADKNGVQTAGNMGQFTEDYYLGVDLHPAMCRVFPTGFVFTAYNFGLLFDKASKSFKVLRSGPGVAMAPNAAPTLDNAGSLEGYDFVWMKEMSTTRGVGLLKSTTDGKFYCFTTKNIVNTTPANLKNPFDPAEPKVLDNAPVFTNATVRTTHLKDPVVYCSKGDNEVWAFQPANAAEQKLITLPSGESVVFIKHIENSDGIADFKHLVVLSNTAEGWKLRCYNFKGVTWELNSDTAVKEYSGEGAAATVLYRGRGAGTNDF